MEQGLDNFHTEAIPDPVIDDSSQPGCMRFLIDILETLVLSVLLFIGINAVSARIRVDGSSMEPSLHSGEFIIVNRLAYKFGSPDHGDVVVFDFPRDPEQEYIKRIIGLPGDHIQVLDSKVYINDKILNEPYIAAAPRYQGNWDVPDKNLFVLGDNRNNSSDSHSWGPVPIENVIGKALFIYWPPENWGVVTSPETVVAAPYP
ncbi:MAG: signal peptidase I [Chloroflexota bacterium]